MPFSHGSKARVYCNGFDLSSYFRKAASSASVEKHDSTTFGKNSKVFLPGHKEASFSVEGLFDGGVDAVNQVLQAALGTASSLWVFLPAGDALGNRGEGFDGTQTTHEAESPAAELVSTKADVTSNVASEPIVVLHALAGEPATGNTTTFDGLAGTTAGGAGYLQATTPGAIGFTGKIQHSSDNVTWLDLITFGATPATGRNAQRLTASGTIRRYLRASWTNGGAGTTPPFCIAFCRY